MTKISKFLSRFRPNLVAKETEAGFCEDDWLFVKINGNIFRNASLCPRCPFIAVDAKEGKRHQDMEPLKTLKTFRASVLPEQQKVHKNAPFFGLNLGIEETGGTINVDDEIQVIKRCRNPSLLPILVLLNLPILAMFLTE